MSVEIAIAAAWVGFAFFFIFLSSKIGNSDEISKWLSKLFFSLSLTSLFGGFFVVSLFAKSAALVADIGADAAGTLRATTEAAGIVSILITFLVWTVFFLELTTKVWNSFLSPYSKDSVQEIGAEIGR